MLMFLTAADAATFAARAENSARCLKQHHAANDAKEDHIAKRNHKVDLSKRPQPGKDPDTDR